MNACVMIVEDEGALFGFLVVKRQGESGETLARSVMPLDLLGTSVAKGTGNAVSWITYPTC